MQHEPNRQLLRQRRDGKLLGNAQTGTALSTTQRPLRQPSAGQDHDLQVHRSVLQSPETSLGDRLPEPRSFRGKPQLTKSPRPPDVGKVKTKAFFIRVDSCRFVSIRDPLHGYLRMYAFTTFGPCT